MAKGCGGEEEDDGEGGFSPFDSRKHKSECQFSFFSTSVDTETRINLCLFRVSVKQGF
jgi:hypothetical protein